MSGRNERTLKVLHEKSHGICEICSLPMTLSDSNIDHIVPRSLGGLNHRSNYRAVHIECNTKRGNELTEREWIDLVQGLWYSQNGLCHHCDNDMGLRECFPAVKMHVGAELAAFHKTCRSVHWAELGIVLKKIAGAEYRKLNGISEKEH